MTGIARNLAMQYPESNRDLDVLLVPLKKDIVGDVQSFLLVLLVAVGFVLLIACANVANLLLARSTRRKREFAVRAAMGASRWNIIRQLLTETTLIAAIGGGLGLLVAVWGTGAAIRLLPKTVPRAEEVGPDTQVLIFTAALSLLAGILFGLTPALKASQPNLQEALNEGGRGSSGGRHRAQDIIVATEVALALVLLVGAGLMSRSVARLWTESPGCNPNNVLTFSLSIPAAVSASAAQTRAYFEQLQDKLDSIRGVEASSIFVGGLPLSANSYVVPFWLEGRPKPATMSDMDRALFHIVEPEYFKVMGIPLEGGRTLSSQDDEHSPFVTRLHYITVLEQFSAPSKKGGAKNRDPKAPECDSHKNV